jgi:hypothetical protein
MNLAKELKQITLSNKLSFTVVRMALEEKAFKGFDTCVFKPQLSSEVVEQLRNDGFTVNIVLINEFFCSVVMW